MHRNMYCLSKNGEYCLKQKRKIPWESKEGEGQAVMVMNDLLNNVSFTL
jgi:hypothetical protein